MHRPQWCGKPFVLLVLAIIYISQASTCPETEYDFYEDLGCKQLAPNRISGCVTAYDCSMLKKSSEDQCFRKGKIYDEGTKLTIPEDCDFDCICKSGKFSCAVVDCPYLLDPEIPSDCVAIDDDNCCKRHIVCKADAKYTCTFGNETYLPRQTITMDKQGCTTCTCEEGFRGVVEAPFCSRPRCKYQSGYSYYEALAKNCAPFYALNRCCPDAISCADGTEVINAKKPKPEGKLTCKFGNHTISTSDEVFVKNPFPAVCKCVVPPLLTCKSNLDFNTVGYLIDI